MKINEVTQVSEGPLDFAKKVGAGAKGLAQGGIAGAQAGYGAKKAEITQRKDIAAWTKQEFQSWANYQAKIKATGRAVNNNDIDAWFTARFGEKPTGMPASTDPARVNQWLNKELANLDAQGWQANTQSQRQASPLGPTNSALASVLRGMGADTAADAAQAYASTKIAKGGSVTQPTDTQTGVQSDASVAVNDPILRQITVQSRSPLIYQFGGKNNRFTLNDKDKWIRYTPGSTKAEIPVDTNTEQLLDKAAKRDRIDLPRFQTTSSDSTQSTAQATSQEPAQSEPIVQPIPGVPDLTTFSREELLQIKKILQGSM